MIPTHKTPLETWLLVAVAFLANAAASAQPYVDVLSLRAQFFPSNHHSSDLSDSLATRYYEASFLLPLE